MLAGRAADLAGRRRGSGPGLLLSRPPRSPVRSPRPRRARRRAGGSGRGCRAGRPGRAGAAVATEPEGARRTRALALWTAAAAGGGASGWVLGGAISGGLGWEWVFAVNVPVGLAGAALAGRLLPESRERGAAGLDVGARSLTAGVGAVLLGLSRGEADGPPLSPRSARSPPGLRCSRSSQRSSAARSRRCCRPAPCARRARPRGWGRRSRSPARPPPACSCACCTSSARAGSGRSMPACCSRRSTSQSSRAHSRGRASPPAWASGAAMAGGLGWSPAGRAAGRRRRAGDRRPARRVHPDGRRPRRCLRRLHRSGDAAAYRARRLASGLLNTAAQLGSALGLRPARRPGGGGRVRVGLGRRGGGGGGRLRWRSHGVRRPAAAGPIGAARPDERDERRRTARAAARRLRQRLGSA